MRRAIHKNTRLSAIHAHANPPSAKTRTKTLKLTDIVVNCMMLVSQTPGSKSIYAENKEVATIVITKGTVHISIRLHRIR